MSGPEWASLDYCGFVDLFGGSSCCCSYQCVLDCGCCLLVLAVSLLTVLYFFESSYVRDLWLFRLSEGIWLCLFYAALPRS